MIVITKSGAGLKVATDTGNTYFVQPILTATPTRTGARVYADSRANLIEIEEGSKLLVLALADITSIGGNSTSGTVTGALDQLTALLT